MHRARVPTVAHPEPDPAGRVVILTQDRVLMVHARRDYTDLLRAWARKRF